MILVKNLSNAHFNIPVKAGVKGRLPDVQPGQIFDVTAQWGMISKPALLTALQSNTIDLFVVSISVNAGGTGYSWQAEEADQARTVAVVNAHFMDLVGHLNPGNKVDISIELLRIPAEQINMED